MSHTQNNFDLSKIKVIGFDMDQTLYPKSPEIDDAIQGYLYKKISELKKVSREKAKKMFDNLYQAGQGFSGSKSLEKIGFPVNQAKELVQEALENADIAKFLQPNTETKILLHNIKNKYKNVDLITGSNEKNTAKKIKQMGIELENFSHILTKDQGSKSDLSAFYLWLELYPDYKPENFLYIGDRVSSDYEKPHELGIKSILVNVSFLHPDVSCPQLKSFLDLKELLNI